jgi:succinoglycan biosynthesis protein ExoW
MSIAVVVPYFQRKSGILAATLRSVLEQDCTDAIRVIVVDDASPVPAADEVASVPTRSNVDVRVIIQKNGGPAAARNAGLDALDDAVTHVAFVDSDDAWTPNHLSRAMLALSIGYDFYFADLYQLDQSVSGFVRGGRIDPARHRSLPGADDLHAFDGDMFDQIITGNVIGTSTVVFRRDAFRGLRFDENFFNAGEDYLFWIACARRQGRFCFSSLVEARYGEGVNVYSGSGWGTESFLLRVHNEMKYRKHLLTAFPLTQAQRVFVSERVRELRDSFVAGVIHRLGHRQSIDRRLLLAQARLDVTTLIQVPIMLGASVAKRIKG